MEIKVDVKVEVVINVWVYLFCVLVQALLSFPHVTLTCKMKNSKKSI